MQDILKTERLILRPPNLDDAPLYSRYASDWDIARMTGSLPFPIPVVSTEIKIEMLLSRKRRGLSYPYAITLDGGDIIGAMDIFWRSENDDCELGYWIARPFWGKGYAPEAAKAVMAEANRTLNITDFVAGVFADNPASMRVLEKLGFTKTGSQGDYFSMARLKHMESIGFELEYAAEMAGYSSKSRSLRAAQGAILSVAS